MCTAFELIECYSGICFNVVGNKKQTKIYTHSSDKIKTSHSAQNGKAPYYLIQEEYRRSNGHYIGFIDLGYIEIPSVKGF